MKKPVILIADDDKSIRYAFKELLTPQDYKIIEAADGKEVIKKTRTEIPDLIFLDIAMPEMDGLSVLEGLKEQGSEIPIIIITAYSTMETTIRAVRSGAYEYLTKPLDIHKIRLLVKRCLEERQLKSELQLLRKQIPITGDLYELVGKSALMEEVYKAIGSIASTPNFTNVLILGESGTGKELVARQIHKWGDNPEAPFVPVNLAVLPDTLIESELFGYVKGAFTGAFSNKSGKFKTAETGTIFLDEVGDLSPAIQHKLLRVIQEREYVQLGGNEPQSVEARFIAATHDVLEDKVAEGSFREDLFYRLNVVTIHIPALRDRRDDIPLLADHFLNLYANKMMRNKPHLSPETLDLLMNHNWPGNVRELENCLARALVMIRSDHLLPKDIPFSSEIKKHRLDISSLNSNLKNARRELLEEFEKKFVQQRLIDSRGNVTKAAEIAGINRQSFQRLMQKHNVISSRYKD